MNALRLLTIVFTAVAMAAGFAHLFALPNTITLERDAYFVVQQIYRGWSLLGTVVIAAFVCALLQTILLRHDRRARRASLTATLCIAASLAIFFALVFPGNQRTANWTVAPPDWQALRAHWEYGHALNAILYFAAFCGLVTALLPKTSLHAEAEMMIHAPRERVAALYRDYRAWPRLFPATIRDVRVLRTEDRRVTVEVDHRTEGRVINVMTELAPERIELWESKRRFDATFVNSFETTPDGTRYRVAAEVELKGAARLFAPFLGGYIHRQIYRYVLEPMRRAAEDRQQPA
jgi:hypothetical protein